MEKLHADRHNEFHLRRRRGRRHGLLGGGRYGRIFQAPALMGICNKILRLPLQQFFFADGEQKPTSLSRTVSLPRKSPQFKKICCTVS